MRHIMHTKDNRSFPVIDKLALFIGVVQPLMTIPQVVLVLSLRDASQISFATWFTYDVASVVLLTYGIKHRLLPIIVSQSIWLIVQTLMIALIFIY